MPASVSMSCVALLCIPGDQEQILTGTLSQEYKNADIPDR